MSKDANLQEFNHYCSFKTHEIVSQEPVHESHLFVIHCSCCMFEFCATSKDNTIERRVMHDLCIISHCLFALISFNSHLKYHKTIICKSVESRNTVKTILIIHICRIMYMFNIKKYFLINVCLVFSTSI